MLVYTSKNTRSSAGFDALCFEPENEADCQAIDTLVAAVRVMADLTFVEDDEQESQPTPE